MQQYNEVETIIVFIFWMRKLNFRKGTELISGRAKIRTHVWVTPESRSANAIKRKDSFILNKREKKIEK